jgi:hypothetical protein
MDFELLDGYLLAGMPSKRELVARLQSGRSSVAGTAAFYQGIALLKERVPDLSLMALRIVEAGMQATDESVIRLRALVERARAGGADGERARLEYYEFLTKSGNPSGVEC